MNITSLLIVNNIPSAYTGYNFIFPGFIHRSGEYIDISARAWLTNIHLNYEKLENLPTNIINFVLSGVYISAQ